MAKNGAFLELPAQPWELQAAALGGLTLSQLRFFISFMLSVVLGAVLKHVPSARGVLGTWHLLYTGLAKTLQRCLAGNAGLQCSQAGLQRTSHLPALAAPKPAGRHIFSLVTGVALIVYPFGSGCMHAFVPAALVYACMRHACSRCGTLAWLIAFPYLILQ